MSVPAKLARKSDACERESDDKIGTRLKDRERSKYIRPLRNLHWSWIRLLCHRSNGDGHLRASEFHRELARGDRIFDLIQADLWNSRPQLFEVWLLTSLLRWLSDRGYELQLLKLSTQPSGRCEWRLPYPKDAEPCARLSGRPDAGSVYFQRYRPGDMPDICFIPESGSDAQPLWVVDAKHSDARGYGLSHYSRTATRYGASHGIRLSAFLEYFPRPNLNHSELGRSQSVRRAHAR